MVRAPKVQASSIVESLKSGELNAEQIFAAFEELDGLPPDDVREAIVEWTGAPPDPSKLDAVTRAAHRLPPLPLRLRTATFSRDADVLFLGDIALDQLRRVGIAWDGNDLEPEERLDGEADGSFATSLEHRILSEPDGAPLYDVLTHDSGNGLVFRAGTTVVVGDVADGIVEMRDRVARTAIQEALSAPPPAPSVRAAVEEKDDEEIEVAPPKKLAAKEKAAPEPKKKAAAASAAPKKKAAAASAAPKKKAAAASAAPKKKAAAESAAAPKKKASSESAAPKKKAAASTPKKTATKKAAAAPKKKASSESAAAPKKKTTAKASRGAAEDLPEPASGRSTSRRSAPTAAKATRGRRPKP